MSRNAFSLLNTTHVPAAFAAASQVGRLRPERVPMLHNVAHQGDRADSVYIVASGALKARAVRVTGGGR